MGITKNIQADENIRKMASAAFPYKTMESATELTEGLCNVAYLVVFTDGSKSVLKIASAGGCGLLKNEVGLMKAETYALSLVEDCKSFKAPKVQFYDNSRTLCTGDYFFMECLEGENYLKISDKCTEEEKEQVNRDVGKSVKEIIQIKGDKFGQLGDMDNACDCLYDLIRRLISNNLSDAAAKNVEIGVPAEDILAKLERDRGFFDEIKEPVLVHYDLWEGNFFTMDRKLTGLIDWERAMWGEPLMEDRFRRHSWNKSFLEGYGQTEFNDKEMRRIRWYDIVLYLQMMTEGAYREYEDDGQYNWIKPLFDASYSELI